jgi:hypothetical protein
LLGLSTTRVLGSFLREYNMHKSHIFILFCLVDFYIHVFRPMSCKTSECWMLKLCNKKPCASIHAEARACPISKKN